jgi:endonuclease/exonuclease/phosphatase family metal-dependent hydrolase
MALVTRVGIGKKALAVYNLHLESRSQELRRAQLAELLAETRRHAGGIPVVVAGDFNFDVTEGSIASAIRDGQFENPFEDRAGRTTRSRRGRRGSAIDWILIRGPLRSVAAQVHDSVSASDHYPLCVTLELCNGNVC